MLPKISLGRIETIVPNQRERFAAMEMARKEMETITAESRVKIAQTKRTPELNVLKLKEGDPVLVFREKPEKWDGPYRYVSQDRKTVIVTDSKGEKHSFSVTMVKPCNAADALCMSMDESLSKFIDRQVHSNSFFASTADIYNTITIDDPNDPRFDEAKKIEMDGLFKRGSFKFVGKTTMPPNPNMLGGRFVLTIKEPGTPDQLRKARLVLQGHIDKEKKDMVNEAPTALRSSMRLLVLLGAAYKFEIWTRDVTQACIQSTEDLLRDVHLKPPAGMGAPESKGIKVVKPHYGITEAGTCWWETFVNYHFDNLKMKQSIMDPCLLYKQSNGALEGLGTTLVDDTLGAGAKAFMKLEADESHKFTVKDRKEGNALKLNGSTIKKDKENAWHIAQESYAEKLNPLSKNERSYENFRSLHGKLNWMANCTRPDVAFESAVLSQITEDAIQPSHYLMLSSAIRNCKRNKLSLKCPHINMDTAKICGFSDASFANAADLSSQLGMVIILCDDQNNAGIAHYCSWKSPRVTRSVLAAETYAFSTCFDFAHALKKDLFRITGKDIKVIMCADSKRLFDAITRLTGVTEKRLLIDITALRQAYTTGELSNVALVSSESNIADGLTKRNRSHALQALMNSGTLSIEIRNWIAHHGDQNQ